jgi:hypothetical protein
MLRARKAPARKPVCAVAALPRKRAGQPAAEMADHRHRLLLRSEGAQRDHRAADEEKQLAPPHSMTSSARARIDCGTVRPSAVAVLRLTTSSNLVGCSTGRSAGFGALEDLPDTNADLAIDSREAGSIADQERENGRRGRAPGAPAYDISCANWKVGICSQTKRIKTPTNRGP